MGMGMHCSSFPEKGMEVEMGRMGDTVGWKLYSIWIGGL
jgi:hypothetical protein